MRSLSMHSPRAPTWRQQHSVLLPQLLPQLLLCSPVRITTSTRSSSRFGGQQAAAQVDPAEHGGVALDEGDARLAQGTWCGKVGGVQEVSGFTKDTCFLPFIDLSPDLVRNYSTALFTP